VAPTTMRHLVTLGGGFEAKLLAARLGAEGVLCELRGSVDGPYPLGPVHVYVEEAGLETARVVLALGEDAEVDHAGWADAPPEAPGPWPSARDRRKVLAVLAVGLVAVLVLLELVRHAAGPEGSQLPTPSGVSASPTTPG
jgi:hypothetical protein